MQKEDVEVILATGKVMFFIWLNNLFIKKQASFDEENSNIINLSPYVSTWFCIGKEEESNISFIGIQENMIPWFFEAQWNRAIVDEENGNLYLTCAENSQEEDLTIAIKTRKIRLKVFTHNRQENEEMYLDFRVIKVRPNNDVEVSEKVYKRCKLEVFTSKRDIVMPSPEDLLESQTKNEKNFYDTKDEKFKSVKFFDDEDN